MAPIFGLMSRCSLRAGIALAAVAISVSACGSHGGSSSAPSNLTGTIRVVLKPPPGRGAFALFDPTGHAPVSITTSDVVRSSVKAVQIRGQVSVYVGFTARGRAKLCRLTRELARRGSRLRQMQRMALRIGARSYGRPLIDYQAFPNGLCGSPGIEITMKDMRAAQHVVRLLR